MTENLQIINEISKFLNGSNDKVKYVVNVEAFPFSNYANCIIHEPGKDPLIHRQKFTSFLYMKDLKRYGKTLYGGQKEALESQMEKYGIKLEILQTGNHPRMVEGYTTKISSSISYTAIQNFLKAGGLDMWEKDKDGSMPNKHLFYTLALDEQFFISTGIRLYKGIEQYAGVHRLIFDIETTGLRPFSSRVFLIGMRDNRNFETILKVAKENDDDEERILIEKFFNIIDKLKPAIISGYNSEEFDFFFILERAKILGILTEDKKNRFSAFIGEFKTTLDDSRDDNGNFRHKISRKPHTSVKYGNTTDYYTATQMWGYSVTDILHAVKRTAALNTEIKSTKLKYIAKYEDIAKPDRMYIKGENIFSTWKENKLYITNPATNDYELIPDEFQEQAEKFWYLQSQKEKISVEEYKQLRTQTVSGMTPSFYDWQISKKTVYGDKYKFLNGIEVVERYLFDDLWETEKIDNLYSQSSFLLSKMLPTSYVRVSTMGNASVWNLLMTTWSYERGLAIPICDKQEKFSGGLARCYRKGLNKRIIKLDFASLYPMLQLTYGIFPKFDITGVIRKMLLYMSTTRNIYKNLANGKPLKGDQVELLKLIDEESYVKYVSGEPFSADEKNSFKVKQLPIKIINNSLFGALGSAEAFNWSDNTCAAEITCRGRLHLRKMIAWYKNYGMIPLLAVTDGVNFSYPEKSNLTVEGVELPEAIPIKEAWQYVGADGKTYDGVKALVEKFNTDVMPKPFMGVDIDGTWESSLNLSRINYANLTEKSTDKNGKPVDKKVKLTGNTIKSKVMPEYIEEFIDRGLRLILEDDGVGFVDYYNEYLAKIFYKQIPLKKIATKKKYKITVNQYRNRGVDKNGRKKAKMAFMEAVMIDRDQMVMKQYKEMYGEGTNVEIDDMYDAVAHVIPNEPEMDSYIYFVNVGKKRGHKDSSMMDDGNGNQVLCSKIINTIDLENNPDILGEYNVDKYVEAFNKRVSTILEGFDPSLRKMILVKNPKNCEQFSESELQLKSFAADDYDASMVLEEKELDFWNRTGLKPSSIWDGYKLPEPTALDEINEYYEKINELNEKMKNSSRKQKVISVNDELVDDCFVLAKNYNTYDLFHYKDNMYTVVRSNMYAPQQGTEYDFFEGGLSKKMIEFKREMAKKFKQEFGLPEEKKLSTIVNDKGELRGLIMFEQYIKTELAKLDKDDEEEEDSDEDDD